VRPLPKSTGLPVGLTLEETPAFVPRMVMTPELRTVVRDVLRQWVHRDRFAGLTKYGIRPLDRVLFFGPPGNGKTLSCQWMAGQLKVPLYRIRCEQIRGPYLGETTRRLGEVTEYLNGLTEPAIALFDEVESIFIDRAKSDSGGDREIGSALTVFFQALDRWQAPTLIVMATNLIEQVDRALLSRTELRLEFGGPTREQAQEMLAYWRELLCEHGADEWSPEIAARIDQCGPPESFRSLQQSINRAARNWVAAGIEGNGVDKH
jgi:ATP-dependent 26S proteasome regulatory subunit